MADSPWKSTMIADGGMVLVNQQTGETRRLSAREVTERIMNSFAAPASTASKKEEPKEKEPEPARRKLRYPKQIKPLSREYYEVLHLLQDQGQGVYVERGFIFDNIDTQVPKNCRGSMIDRMLRLRLIKKKKKRSAKQSVYTIAAPGQKALLDEPEEGEEPGRSGGEGGVVGEAEAVTLRAVKSPAPKYPEGVTTPIIAEAASLSKAQVSNAATRLLRKGLISCQGRAPNTGRLGRRPFLYLPVNGAHIH